MTRALFEKIGRRPRSSFDLARGVFERSGQPLGGRKQAFAKLGCGAWSHCRAGPFMSCRSSAPWRAVQKPPIAWLQRALSSVTWPTSARGALTPASTSAKRNTTPRSTSAVNPNTRTSSIAWARYQTSAASATVQLRSAATRCVQVFSVVQIQRTRCAPRPDLGTARSCGKRRTVSKRYPDLSR